MVETEETSESRDGKGSGDHDKPFVWGQWRICLTPIQQARLTIMRGYVRDHTGPIVGDADWILLGPSNTLLYVATDFEPEV